MPNYPIHLVVDHAGMGIPYYRSEDETESHSYINLKTNPEQINLIPEIQGWPKLEEAIRTLNAPDSIFETTGCAKWFFPDPNSPDIKRLVTYLGFCLSDTKARRNVYNLYGFFHTFSEFLYSKTLPENLTMQYVIKDTGFNGDTVKGWSVDLEMIGSGSSEAEAIELPSLAVSLLLECIRTDTVRNWLP